MSLLEFAARQAALPLSPSLDRPPKDDDDTAIRLGPGEEEFLHDSMPNRVGVSPTKQRKTTCFVAELGVHPSNLRHA